jgi:hypothetical protein
MAAPIDPLSALARLTRLERLESLLGAGATTPAAGVAASATPVTPVGAIMPGEAIQPEQPSVADTHAGSYPRGADGGPAPQAGAGNASSHTRLSADAALIARLLEEADTPGVASKLTGAAVDASAELPAQLAQSLARSLSTTGVFYESHLQEWIAGERPLAALRTEPHNRLPPGAPRMTMAPAATGEGTVAMADTPTASPTEPTRSAAPMPEALAAIVREQLDTLDLRRVHWHGEVWPQQPAQLEIAAEAHRHEDADGEDGTDTPDMHCWRSTLRLTLPQLGVVEVHIGLDPQGADISVRADDHALAALQPGRSAFAEALTQAGVAVRLLELKAHA